MTKQRNLSRRAYLGFGVEATPSPSQPKRERWIISEIDPGSPADKSGLQLGDDVVRLDDVEVTSLADLRVRGAKRKAEELTSLDVLRKGSLLRLTLHAVPMPLERLLKGHVMLDEVPWRHEGRELRLRAIWTVPEGPARAVLWLLPSASWVTQETPLCTWDPGYHLIDQLTAHGVITLRVDRPGLGDSEGPAPQETDFHTELSAWTAAREYLFEHKLTKSLPRFLYGRSLGGMFAPLLATDKNFDGVIVWGTSAAPWHAASLRSFRQQLEQSNLKGGEFQKHWADTEQLLSLIYEEELSPHEAFARAPHLAKLFPDEYTQSRIHDRVPAFFQQLNRASIAEAWQEVNCPVLALSAEYDILTRPSELKRIVELAGSRAQFLSMVGVDHFMHQRTSQKEAVQVPWGGTFAPEVTRAILNFTRSTFRE